MNYFTADPLVPLLVERRLPEAARAAALERLSAFGELCGGRLASLIEAAHLDENRPRLRKYGRWGERVDEVEYCAEQVEARRLAFAAGMLPPRPFLERMTMAYLLNQNGEGGVACPLAMTDGLLQLLESHGTAEQKSRWMPLLNDPGGPTPFTAGQFVTEKQGGSIVSENESRAEPAEDGSWRLTGLKWFCSNPGELWVTTAKPKGSEAVALFLVPRRLPDGSLNECHILRLKDLSGTWGKATAEVEYRGARAELIGRPSRGIALLLRTVLRTSRIHVAVGSLGMMRRALAEAQAFASERRVLGRPVAELPHAREALRRMEAAFGGAAPAVYEMLDLEERGNPAAEVLVPLLKIEVSRAASEQVREARLLLAGAGALRDFSILPRLAEDALVQEIWEGTPPVLAGHVLKALRKPRPRAAFLSLLESRVAAHKGQGAPAQALEAAEESRRLLDGELKRLDGLSAEQRAAEAQDLSGLAYAALRRSLLVATAAEVERAGRAA